MYFAMIMWRGSPTPVLREYGNSEAVIALWETREEAVSETQNMTISDAYEIRIFDLDNCE
jgi:hypothetical protein